MKTPLLSILALYNYDNTIFDNLLLPQGVEKDDVLNNLLMELGELEVIYANPEMMKAAIGFWSKKEVPIWTKLLETTKFEYNPIWNFDRTEEVADKETRNLTGTNNETRDLAGTDNETRNLTGTDNETRNLAGTKAHDSTTTGTTTNNGTDITKEYVVGFNEATPTLSKQAEQTLGTGNTVGGTIDSDEVTSDTGTVDRALTDTGTVNKALTDTGTVDRATTDTGTVDNTHNARMYGNIGVTTTQQMIEQERGVVKFNIVDYIIDSFKGRFCILIY
jgi:hypothetical protein